MKAFILFLLPLIMFFFVYQCDLLNNDDPTETSDFSSIITSEPTYGTTGTSFIFEINFSSANDTLTDPDNFQVKWDFDGDGSYDTDWLDTFDISYQFSTEGKKEPQVKFRDNVDKTGSGTTEIHVLEMVQITSNETYTFQGNIDWCPDGSNRVAFDWNLAENVGTQTIWYVTYPSQTVTQVTSHTEANEYHGFPEWSPDGGKIAFNDGNGLQYIDLNTGLHTVITKYAHLDCCWSPDGNWIVYALSDVSTKLYNVAEDSSYDFISGTYQTCWSPDASKLALYELTYPRQYGLKIMDFDTRSIIKEFSLPDIGAKIDWSPNGEWICLGFSESDELSILNYSTGEIHNFSLDGYQSLWYPTWSSDGTMIAFEGEPNNHDTGTEIWAVKVPDFMH